VLTDTDLQALIEFRPAGTVLSVYLNVDPSAGPADQQRLQLRQMLKDFEDRAPDDVQAVERYVDYEFEGSGRSLAMFSCAEADYFRAFALAVPLRSRARWMDRPYVKPIADLIDRYGNYGVAVIDRQGVRLFHFHLGQLREQEGTFGEAIRRTKRGGGTQSQGRRGGLAGGARAAAERADRNLREAAQAASAFFDGARVRRVLIGGTEQNVARFSALLPKKWQSLIVGSFPIRSDAGHAQILEKANEVAHRAEVERERRLVESVITAAAKGREGVINLDRTLAAINAGQVQTLIISEGYRAPGYRCRGCGYLTAHLLPECPFCGNVFSEIEDAVELAVRRVMEEGGDVEVVHDSPLLERAGQIGGQLRY
jgi:peptide chain release factor subunit 1